MKWKIEQHQLHPGFPEWLWLAIAPGGAVHTFTSFGDAIGHVAEAVQQGRQLQGWSRGFTYGLLREQEPCS